MNFVIRGRFVAIKGRHEMLYYIEREGERERKSVILDPYRTSGQYDRNLSFTCTTENKVIRSGFTISSRMKNRTEENIDVEMPQPDLQKLLSLLVLNNHCAIADLHAHARYSNVFETTLYNLRTAAILPIFFFPSMQRFSTIIQT